MNIMRIRKFSIGMTSAIVTSMGLIAGLAHGANTKTSIVAGLLIFAVADNISDSLGIHIYKESEGADRGDIAWSTFGNFFVRFMLALTFILIVMLLPPDTAFIVSSLWGLILLTVLSYVIAKAKGTRPLPEIIYHIIIALLVIIGSKIMGTYIADRIAGP